VVHHRATLESTTAASQIHQAKFNPQANIQYSTANQLSKNCNASWSIQEAKGYYLHPFAIPINNLHHPIGIEDKKVN
jgi:hypothetical protein